MYIKIKRDKLEGLVSSNQGDWRVGNKVAFLELQEMGDIVFCFVVRAPGFSGLKEVHDLSEKVCTEQELNMGKAKDWEFITGTDFSLAADGRPVWAIRRTVGGYI